MGKLLFSRYANKGRDWNETGQGSFSRTAAGVCGGCCWNKVTALINDILFINELESFLEDTSCSIKVMTPICWNAAVWEWSKTTLQVFNEDQNTLKDTENLKLFPSNTVQIKLSRIYSHVAQGINKSSRDKEGTLFHNCSSTDVIQVIIFNGAVVELELLIKTQNFSPPDTSSCLYKSVNSSIAAPAVEGVSSPLCLFGWMKSSPSSAVN